MSEAAETPALNSQDIELLLATAGAIQRLVAERNALRSRVATLERELHQTHLAHDCYRKITTEFIAQFQLIDRAVGDLFLAPTAQQQPAEAEGANSPPTAA